MVGETAQRGRGARLYGKIQDDFVTRAGGNYQALSFYSEGVSAAPALEDDQEIGGAVDNDRDQTDPAPGLESASGAISVPADFNQLLFWLQLLFGSPTTVAAIPNYTHTFTSGAAELPAATLEVPIGAGRFKVIDSAMVNSMTFGFGKEAGYRRFNVDVLARRAALLGATVAGAPVDMPARAKLPAAKGIVRINDVIEGSIVGGDLTISNNLEAVNYADDDAAAGGMDPGEAEISSTPRMRFKRGAALNGALDVFASEATPFKYEVEFAISATASLIFTMPRCFAPKTTPTIESAGPVEWSPAGPILAKQTEGGAPLPAITVELINQLETIGA